MDVYSELLELFDHPCALLELDNQTFLLCFILDQGHNSVFFVLNTLVSDGLELKKSREVLNLLGNLLRLLVEQMDVSKARVLIVNEAITSHDHNLLTVEHGYSWQPSWVQLGFCEIDSHPATHALLGSPTIDQLLDRAQDFLTLLTTEDVDYAIKCASTWLQPWLIHLW